MARPSRFLPEDRSGEGERAALVAGRVLAATLGTIRGLLRAAVDGRRMADSVHDLRVATRRAAAALDGFRPLLPRKRAAWFEKRLKRLRRAAGRARDLDCTSAALGARRRGWAARLDDADAARVLKRIAKQRCRAQRAIDGAARRFPAGKAWRARIEKFVARIGEGRHPIRFERFAPRRLTPMLDRFLSAAVAGAPDTAALHRLRILAKKSRYAIETFVAAGMSPPRRRCLAGLERFQDQAGASIDAATASGRFARWADRAESRTDRRTFAAAAKAAAAEAEGARRRALALLTPARLRWLERELARMRAG